MPAMSSLLHDIFPRRVTHNPADQWRVLRERSVPLVRLHGCYTIPSVQSAPAIMSTPVRNTAIQREVRDSHSSDECRNKQGPDSIVPVSRHSGLDLGEGRCATGRAASHPATRLSTSAYIKPLAERLTRDRVHRRSRTSCRGHFGRVIGIQRRQVHECASVPRPNVLGFWKEAGPFFRS